MSRCFVRLSFNCFYLSFSILLYICFLKDFLISGEVSAAGTGVGFFAGRGEVDLAGDFPAGVFISEDGQAQFDGAGQIQVHYLSGSFNHEILLEIFNIKIRAGNPTNFWIGCGFGFF